MADFYKTPPEIVKRNAAVLGATVLATFLVFRVALYLSPDSDFSVGGYNIHHLFTGLLLIVVGGIPLAIFRGFTRRLDVALVVFGVGLGMALDEWVYLIATDGSNASYLLPVSFWGGVVVTGMALTYVVVLVTSQIRQSKARRDPMRTAD
jgi:hypothetical protein